MGPSYKDLVVWKKSIDLVVAIYKLTENFPKAELYGLTSQLRRCAVSIPSNIAEGQGRFTNQDFKRFLSQAMGSVCELETQIVIAAELSYVTSAEKEALLGRAAEIG